VLPYVPLPHGTQKRIAQRVEQHIAVAVGLLTDGGGNLHATE
jgi:hypothetical protein